MTVINPSSISGITSITMPSGDGNVLTIHTNDGTERFRIDSSGNVKVGSACTISQDGDVFFTGVCTATTLAGSGANLTALPAANLTGTLPAISGANLTGIAATDNVRTGILDVAGIATFRNDVNIGAAVTISESGIEASGIGITCASLNGGEFSNRNMVINGAMQVDQRNGGSAVTSNPGGTLNFAADRCHFFNYGTGQLTATLQRVADGPSGFYNSNKVTITTPESSGGTPAADDRFSMQYRIEGRDINRLSLGTSDAKPFVISFYVKVSVAGNYGLAVVSGTSGGRSYCMLYPATTSWTRVVLKVPKVTDGSWQRGTLTALELKFGLYNGSNRTGADQGVAGTGSWQSTDAPQGTTGQYQMGGTNGATWQITGLQVEAGTEATPFEHRHIADDLQACQRYYYKHSIVDGIGPYLVQYHQNHRFVHDFFPVQMRDVPTSTVTFSSHSDTPTAYKVSTTHYKAYAGSLSYDSSTTVYMTAAQYSAEI